MISFRKSDPKLTLLHVTSFSSPSFIAEAQTGSSPPMVTRPMFGAVTGWKRTKQGDDATCGFWLRPAQRRLGPLLTFAGGSIEAVLAQLTGRALETCITRAGPITEVTVIAFPTVATGRVDPSWTHWTERTTQETSHHCSRSSEC